ncbi:hypothetical protein VCRA213O314_160003 [Vibrio crassostreae]|nr:hypothetical protein VCRA213O314_160003 [Vibrio crassostreae]
MKVARTVLRGAALGNKCRLLDRDVLCRHALGQERLSATTLKHLCPNVC